jgi:CheY-like chemotaxis protein
MLLAGRLSRAGEDRTWTVVTALTPVWACRGRIRWLPEMAGNGTSMMDGASNNGGGATGGRMPRVIVVEDHADTLVLMGRLLSMARADGVPVATCAAAREAARVMGAFDVVIADVTLPDGDGVALLAELKAAYGCRTVAMSGYDEPEDGLPAGIDVWISKPVNLTELRRAVGIEAR